MVKNKQNKLKWAAWPIFFKLYYNQYYSSVPGSIEDKVTDLVVLPSL